MYPNDQCRTAVGILLDYVFRFRRLCSWRFCNPPTRTHSRCCRFGVVVSRVLRHECHMSCDVLKSLSVNPKRCCSKFAETARRDRTRARAPWRLAFERSERCVCACVRRARSGMSAACRWVRRQERFHVPLLFASPAPSLSASLFAPDGPELLLLRCCRPKTT